MRIETSPRGHGGVFADSCLWSWRGFCGGGLIAWVGGMKRVRRGMRASKRWRVCVFIFSCFPEKANGTGSLVVVPGFFLGVRCFPMFWFRCLFRRGLRSFPNLTISLPLKTSLSKFQQSRVRTQKPKNSKLADPPKHDSNEQ